MNTELSFAYTYGLFSVSAVWNAYWLDLPFWDYNHFIKTSFSVRSPKSRISSNIGLGFTPDSNQDNVPVIDIDFTVKLTDSVRLALTVSDAVKLISGESRIYSEKYIRKSGNAGTSDAV